MVDRRRVLQALTGVRDPELDEPITELGFVEEAEVDRDSVRVRLRLPTYFCAPNFAYIMAADARAAISSLEGVREVLVELADHFSSDEINSGLSRGLSFEQTFPGEATDDLAELRSLFVRKGFLARQGRICRSLLALGRSRSDLVAMRLRDLPDTPEVREYLRRRRELGIDTSPEAPFVVTAGGQPVPPAELDEHLRMARSMAVSIESNAGLCRSLLRTRYGLAASATGGER